MRICLPSFTFWRKRNTPPLEELSSDEIIKLLLSCDFVSPNSKLHPYLSSEQFVLERTFSMNKATIWHILSGLKEKDHLDLLGFLLNRYRDKIRPEHLNRMSTNGFTPCHNAASNANSKALRLLVEYGADPTVPAACEHRYTPLELAKIHHCNDSNLIKEIEEIVVEYPRIYQAARQKELNESATEVRKRPYFHFLNKSREESSELELRTGLIQGTPTAPAHHKLS